MNIKKRGVSGAAEQRPVLPMCLKDFQYFEKFAQPSMAYDTYVEQLEVTSFRASMTVAKKIVAGVSAPSFNQESVCTSRVGSQFVDRAWQILNYNELLAASKVNYIRQSDLRSTPTCMVPKEKGLGDEQVWIFP